MRCDGAIPLINGTKQKIKYNKTPSPPPPKKENTKKQRKTDKTQQTSVATATARA